MNKFASSKKFKLFFSFWLCRRGTLNQFTVLCEKYQPSIERDPVYKEVSNLNKVKVYLILHS